MKGTLSLISDLLNAIREDATIDQAERWWDGVNSIETSLATTKKSANEDALISQLKSAVSNVIAQIRNRYPSPNISSARIALTALQHEVERHTTGLDGWPLGK